MSQIVNIFSKVQKEHRCANEYGQRNANQAQDKSRLSIMCELNVNFL